MALFNRWKNTVEKLTHPVVQEEKNTEVATEEEASIFAIIGKRNRLRKSVMKNWNSCRIIFRTWSTVLTADGQCILHDICMTM